MPKGRTSATVRLEGARELRAALKAVSDDMEDLKATHKEVAEVVARRAAVLAPSRTGMLRDSIKSKGTQSKGYISAGWRTTVPYAGPIHFGSPRGWPPDGIGGFGRGTLRAQPFMYDTMDERRAEVLDMYQDRLEEVVRRKGLGLSLRPSLDTRL